MVEGAALENLRPFGSFVRRKTLILLGFSNLKIEYFLVFFPVFLPKSFLNEFLLVGKTD